LIKTNMAKKIAIIGSGFSGLSAAAYSAKSGNEVHVFEKNSSLGGRARSFRTDNGYTFDMVKKFLTFMNWYLSILSLKWFLMMERWRSHTIMNP